MSLTREEVEKIADLAKLELSEGERESFRGQLSSILEYVGKMSEVDIKDADPMSHAIPLLNVLRPDEVGRCPEDVRDAVVASFPESEDEMLKVKAVFS